MPLPILALTAITQPDDGEFIAGLCAFVPLLAALAVLFGGDSMKASELTQDFELKRAIRGVVAGLVAVALLVGPLERQLPLPRAGLRPVRPAAEAEADPALGRSKTSSCSRSETDSGVTGPWRTGVLDVYDGEAWRLPPFDKARFTPLPADGIVDPS